jgi:O-antigen/teichoic acid export membrane protein
LGLFSKLNVGDFGRVLMRFASAQIISNFLRLLSGFLIIRLLDPSEYGLYSGVGVYMGYILLGHGGILNGLNRELPYELGRNNDEYAREMASSAYVLSLLISVLVAFIFLVFAVGHLMAGNNLTGFIYMSYVLVAGLQLLNRQYLPILYRTNKDFNSLSRQNILKGIGNLLTVLLVWFLGIYGLIIRGALLALYEFTLLYKNKPYTLTLKYDFIHFKKLFKTGLPIFMVGQVNQLWATIMNNIIFSFGGALYFGLYALSTIVQGALGIIPSAFSQVIYPRMSIMLGKGKSVTQILKANVKPLIFQFGVTLVVSIVGALILPVIIPLALPKYIDGIAAAQWIIFVPAVQSIGAMNNIYNVVKRQKWYFVSLVTGAIVGSIFVYLQILKNGFYLEVFPQGLLLGTAIQQILSLGFIKLLLSNEK